MYKLVIWDVDGTLLDTGDGLKASVIAAANENGYEAPDDKTMDSFVGPPIKDSLKNYYHLDEEEATRLMNEFRNFYKQDEYLLLAHPYDGIPELMKAISDKGIKQAVATNKRQDYAERIVNHFGLGEYCDVICGADFEGKLIKPDIIELAMGNFEDVDKSEIIMIGDTHFDEEGARKVGIPFLPVSYGYGFTEGCESVAKIAKELGI